MSTLFQQWAEREGQQYGRQPQLASYGRGSRASVIQKDRDVVVEEMTQLSSGEKGILLGYKTAEA